MTVEEAFGENWIKDDQLRMIFMCCHPSLSPENRITLILKTLCGLSVTAIARALLTTEATVNKRLYRTRVALGGVRFEIPAAGGTPGRTGYRSHSALSALQRRPPVHRRQADPARVVPRCDAAHATAGRRPIHLLERHARAARAHVLQRRATGITPGRWGTAGAARSAGSIAVGPSADSTRAISAWFAHRRWTPRPPVDSTSKRPSPLDTVRPRLSTRRTGCPSAICTIVCSNWRPRRWWR